MFNLFNRKLGKKGFTLIELIVVIAIIAILAVILIPRFTGFTDSANAKTAMSDARNILIAAQALTMEDKDVTTATLQAYGVDIATMTKDGRATLDLDDIEDGDFEYVLTKNNKTYTVTVDNWTLPTDADASAAPSAAPEDDDE